jgi:hypothetical protein
LLALNFFWKDKEAGIQGKYLLCGLLVSLTSLYVISLKPWGFSPPLIN